MAEDFAVELISKLSEQIKVEPPFTAEVISIDASVSSDKRVLIYHTHTYEAYEQSEATTYQQTEKWRTTDSSYNMIAVGKAIKEFKNVYQLSSNNNSKINKSFDIDDDFMKLIDDSVINYKNLEEVKINKLLNDNTIKQIALF